MSIKITVAYTAPVTDKFDALLEQYGEVERLSNETVNYYRPLAEAAEETKAALILEQLKTIHEYLRKLNRINEYITSIDIRSQTGVNTLQFSVRLENGECVNEWNRVSFTIDNVKRHPANFTAKGHDRYNILGNWDKWEMYEKLEAECMDLLKFEVAKQKRLAENEKKRLENIVGG